MKLTMGSSESKYGAPVGMYPCKFLGAKEKDHPEYGPGLEWQFEVTSGDYKGKILTRTTGTEPTLKNGCGRIISQLTGGEVKVGGEIDLEAYEGKTYQVLVEVNSTGNGTRIGTVMPVSGQSPSPSPVSPPGKPPKATLRGKDGKSIQTPSPPPDRFWVQVSDGEPVEMTRQELQDSILKDEIEAPALAELPVMRHDREGGWKTAADFGLTPFVPF